MPRHVGGLRLRGFEALQLLTLPECSRSSTGPAGAICEVFSSPPVIWSLFYIDLRFPVLKLAPPIL